MRSSSGMITFQLKHGLGAAITLAEKIRLFTYATSLGHARSLLFYYPADLYVDAVPYLTDAQKTRIRQWTGDGIVRVSVGLEDRHDIVSGYRQRRRDHLVRRLNARCWGALVQAVLGLRCRDVDSAFKLYRREIFDRIELRSTGALIDAEILARAARAGYTLTEVPVRHRPRRVGQQTGSNPRVILRAFKELMALRGNILAAPPEGS